MIRDEAIQFFWNAVLIMQNEMCAGRSEEARVDEETYQAFEALGVTREEAGYG